MNYQKFLFYFHCFGIILSFCRCKSYQNNEKILNRHVSLINTVFKFIKPTNTVLLFEDYGRGKFYKIKYNTLLHYFKCGLQLITLNYVY